MKNIHSNIEKAKKYLTNNNVVAIKLMKKITKKDQAITNLFKRVK